MELSMSVGRPVAVLTPRWLFEVWGMAGSLRRAEAGVWWEDGEEERPLSMMAVANEADFFRTNLLLLAVVVDACCCESASVLPPFPVEADAVADPDPDAVAWYPAFRAALPLTSLASSAADFFLDLSSSEDRLDDIMVSKVP